MGNKTENLSYFLYHNLDSEQVRNSMYDTSKSLFNLDASNPLVSTVGDNSKTSYSNQQKLIDSSISKIETIKGQIELRTNILFGLIVFFSVITLLLILALSWKIFYIGDTSILEPLKFIASLISGLLIKVFFSMYNKERKELKKINTDLIKVHRTQTVIAITEQFGKQNEMETLDLQKIKEIIIKKV